MHKHYYCLDSVRTTFLNGAPLRFGPYYYFKCHCGNTQVMRRDYFFSTDYFKFRYYR
jgi:hypothetical protein